MADLPVDPGQVSAITTETLHGVAGLSPAAQVAAMVVVGVVAGLWIWTRKPQSSDNETMKVMVHAMTETAASIATMSGQNERIVEEMRSIAAEVRGLTGVVLSAYPPCAPAPVPERRNAMVG